ncbi:MAG: hypothetical protein K2X93_01050 [Candidatus Obscuribacterales bacterium]|nr:hypothetical protein [Candidatus Obscuribacterales bacterium]
MEFSEIMQSPAVPEELGNSFDCGFAMAAQEAWKPEKMAEKKVDATSDAIQLLLNAKKFIQKDANGDLQLTGPGSQALVKYMAAGNYSSARAENLQQLLKDNGINVSLAFREFHIKHGRLQVNSGTYRRVPNASAELEINVKPSGVGTRVVGAHISNIPRRGQ